MAMLDEGGPITVRLYKQKSTNSAVVWANTYEFIQDAPGKTEADFAELVDSLAAAEAELHYATTRYMRGVVSTLVPDGEPYNPLSFYVRPLTTLGARDETGLSVEPLHVCYRIAKQVSFGRQGFQLYRNALAENEVSAPAGVPVLEFGPGNAAFQAFQTAMAPFLMATGTFRLVLASGSNIRIVSALVEAGVTIKKFNNRYFDRAVTTP